MIDENENEANRSLEQQFTNEDSHLQTALCELRMAVETMTTSENSQGKNKVAEALQKAKVKLVVVQKYSLKEVYGSYNSSTMFLKTLRLETKKEVVPEWIGLSKPSDLMEHKNTEIKK